MNFMENHPICRGRAQIADICQTFLLYNCFLEGLLYVKIPSLARLQCPTGGLRWRSLLPPPDVKQYHHHHHHRGYMSEYELSGSGEGGEGGTLQRYYCQLIFEEQELLPVCPIEYYSSEEKNLKVQALSLRQVLDSQPSSSLLRM